MGGFALDALLSAGTIDARQHAAGLAYAELRLRHDTAKHGGSGLSLERWTAVKRDHAALLAAAGFEQFMLDRLCIHGEAPLRCVVERVGAVLGRVTEHPMRAQYTAGRPLGCHQVDSAPQDRISSSSS